MKRAAFLFLSMIGMIGLAACQENNGNQSRSANQDGTETIVMELELDSNYDVTEPFVNELLFCVSQDIDVLGAEASIQMEGASGNETSAITLKNISKKKEYV